jgi:hypothetical protein
MENQIHHASSLKTCIIILVMVGIVAVQGWLAIAVIGDLGQPDWDYRPVRDVPGESPYAISSPYHPADYPQHVLGKPGEEAYQMNILPFQQRFSSNAESKGLK